MAVWNSYLPEEDAQLVSAEEPTAIPVSLTTGGAELLIKHDTGKKQCVKTIGSREFLKYYKQKPRPSEMHDGALVNALVTRYCLDTHFLRLLGTFTSFDASSG